MDIFFCEKNKKKLTFFALLPKTVGMKNSFRRFIFLATTLTLAHTCIAQGNTNTPGPPATPPVQLVESSTVPVLSVNGQRFVPVVVLNAVELGQQVGSQIKTAAPSITGLSGPTTQPSPWVGYGTAGTLALMVLGRIRQSAKCGDSILRALKTIFMGSVHASIAPTASLSVAYPPPAPPPTPPPPAPPT